MIAHRAIGGSIVADYGTLTLTGALDLASFYARESRHWREDGEASAAQYCADREAALRAAITSAIRWRRAAGWRDPAAADAALRPFPTPPFAP